MPCSYYGPGEEDVALRKELDRVTRSACAACKFIEASGLAVPADARVWWQSHKAADRDREERERSQKAAAALRKKLLDGMTSEEKAALGIE